MEGILHRKLLVNGINMHVAEKGEGPVVLLLHGFPEGWYSWRHQIVSLAGRGYKAVAPDLRGYGDTDAPPSIESYTVFNVVGDLIALIDALGQDQVFVVGHDWGALIAWDLCMFRGDRVKGLVALSVPFMRRNPNVRTVDGLRALYGDDYYICRFQEPGAAEADIARTGTTAILKIFFTLRDPGPLILPPGGFFDWPDKNPVLPNWLSEEDIGYYASKFGKIGFTGGLNYYRNMNRRWELEAPWTGAKVKVPAIYIVGDLDLVYNTMGNKEYIRSGKFHKDVPLLEEIVVVEGVGHFIQMEVPDKISNYILNFLQNH